MKQLRFLICVLFLSLCANVHAGEPTVYHGMVDKTMPITLTLIDPLEYPPAKVIQGKYCYDHMVAEKNADPCNYLYFSCTGIDADQDIEWTVTDCEGKPVEKWCVSYNTNTGYSFWWLEGTITILQGIDKGKKHTVAVTLGQL